MSGEPPLPLPPEAPSVALADIASYAFCDLRYWWSHKSSGTEDAPPASLSADDLLRESLRQAVQVYYKYKEQGKKDISLADAGNMVWNSWTQQWGVSELRQELLGYFERYQRILHSFTEAGGIRRRDGSLYPHPEWSNHWQDLAQSTGLLEYRRRIETFHPKIGLPSMEKFADDDRFRPMGLAEAYARSIQSAEANQHKNALPESVLGRSVALSLDLLSVRLTMTVDIVISAGAIRGKGHPRKDGNDVREGLIYEVHLYDEDIPTPEALEQDLLLAAIQEARPVAWPDTKDTVVRSLLVRHMRTGQVQPVHPRKNSMVPVLEGLARSLLTAERTGVYVPRSLGGWKDCGDCPRRPSCFQGEGVLNRFNPAMARRAIEDPERVISLRNALSAVRDRGRYAKEFQPLLQWLSKHPDIRPEQAAWALQAWSEENG